MPTGAPAGGGQVPQHGPDHRQAVASLPLLASVALRFILSLSVNVDFKYVQKSFERLNPAVDFAVKS